MTAFTLQVPNPAFRDVVREKLALNRFARYVGFEMLKVEPGFTEGRVKMEEHHRQQEGWAHGGLLMTLCDIVAGFAAYTMTPAGQRVVTAEIKVSCLRPAKGDILVARGSVIKAGSHFHFCESEVWSYEGDESILAAKATTTMAVIDGANSEKSEE
jgi:uncharacterized protein (TIGR00369 family)